ncbi:MAG: hypothetical protein EBT03_08160 [Betaproteobacteria bacterium]|nr:hypothetical protein [Betaproteobacteria bacterium]
MDIQSITLSQVRRAYIGKVGCMCGCKGKYFAVAGKEVEVDPQWISFDSGGRRWCCYLAD